ncbi:MAG: helix-turn-helix domain-containing protein [Micrococcales bacterium]|nr:helix-turn-helix domain-containing protein [Micrococcales bacterium]
MTPHTAHLRAPADFGVVLQQARLSRGLSQARLAAELNLSQSEISEIESGKSTIYLRRLLTIARATGVELTATWQDADAPHR